MESQKYPRTFHLPWSPGCTSDDKRLVGVESLLGHPLVVTEKMDGSNVCMERDACFARSHTGAPAHPSFDMFKALHASMRHYLPEGLQLFGEWLFAKHSIHYTNLPSYFMVFGVRDQKTHMWAPWLEVELWAEELGFPTVPVLAKLTCSTEKALHNVELPKPACGPEREGYVVRWESGFRDEDFPRAVAKFVRAGHVQTSDHWTHQEPVRNLLRVG